MNPLFSIIIPSYNVEKYLGECLNSIMRQGFGDFEVIVVDDGSEDKTPAICDQFEHSDERIKVIHKINGGESAARYDAVKRAVGDYICCIDADDWIDGGLFSEASKIVRQYDPDIIIYGFRTENARGKKNESYSCGQGFYPKKKLENEIYPWLIQSAQARYFHPSVCGAFFKRDLFKNNILNNRHAEFGADMAVSVPCFANATSMYSIEKAYYNYRYNAQSVTKAGKAYDWACPIVTNSHIASRVDLDKYDFREQLYRKIVHDLWITACSRFNNNYSYGKIKQEILEHMNETLFSKAINEAEFSSVKAIMMLSALQRKDIFSMFLYNKLEGIFI